MCSEYTYAASVFKAFADENRIRILKLLSSGDRCACELLEELNITQPTLSHHLKILCDAGIVVSKREGKWMHYSICCDGVKRVREQLQELLAPEKLPKKCRCDENFPK